MHGRPWSRGGIFLASSSSLSKGVLLVSSRLDCRHIPTLFINGPIVTGSLKTTPYPSRTVRHSRTCIKESFEDLSCFSVSWTHDVMHWISSMLARMRSGGCSQYSVSLPSGNEAQRHLMMSVQPSVMCYATRVPHSD